ncbi:MAG: carbohydrate-binding domain-containing protein, partial [Planctomycetota bacterium]
TSPATPFAQRTNPFDPGDASVTYPDNLDTPAATTQHGDTVGWCVGGEWFEQAVDLRAGVYDLAVDAAAPATDVEIDVLLNGTVLGTLRLAETDGFADHRTNVLRNIPITTDTSGVLRFEIDGSACDVASVRMERAGAFDEELAAEAGVRKLLAERAASNGRHEVEAQRTDMLSVSDADFERLDHSDDPIVDVPTSPVEQNAQQGEAGDVNRDMAEALVAMADTLLPTEPPPAEQPTPVDDTTDEIDTLADAYGLELEEPAATDDATPPAEPTVEPPPVTDEPHAPTGLAQVAEVPDASRTVTVRRAEAGSGWTLGYVRGNDSDWYAGETKPMGARGGKWSALSASATPEALTAVAWPQVNASPVALWTNDGPTPVTVDIAGELTVDWHKTGNDRLAHPALRADVVVGVAATSGKVRPLFVATDLAKPTQTWQRESRRLDFAGQAAELMPGESVLVGLRVHGADGQAFGVTLTDALVLEITPLST